jgi:SPP1 gp7 family putative phage head morphogenesis protein
MEMTVDRARMIARTEMNRAANMGHIDGARESGLNLKKRWDAHLDNRTSPVCRALDGKTVGIDEKFVHNGEEFDAPPAHPNCRSTLIFIQEDEQ